MSDEPRIVVLTIIRDAEEARVTEAVIGSVLRQARPPDEYRVLVGPDAEPALDARGEDTARYPFLETLSAPAGADLAEQVLSLDADWVLATPPGIRLHREFLRQAADQAVLFPEAGVIFSMVQARYPWQERPPVLEPQPRFFAPSAWRDRLGQQPLATFPGAHVALFRKAAWLEEAARLKDGGLWADSARLILAGLQRGAVYVPAAGRSVDPYALPGLDAVRADPHEALRQLDAAVRILQSSNQDAEWLSAWRAAAEYHVVRAPYLADIWLSFRDIQARLQAARPKATGFSIPFSLLTGSLSLLRRWADVRASRDLTRV
jgi:hypothetical protein